MLLTWTFWSRTSENYDLFLGASPIGMYFFPQSMESLEVHMVHTASMDADLPLITFLCVHLKSELCSFS